MGCKRADDVLPFLKIELETILSAKCGHLVLKAWLERAHTSPPSDVLQYHSHLEGVDVAAEFPFGSEIYTFQCHFNPPVKRHDFAVSPKKGSPEQLTHHSLYGLPVGRFVM